jgi:hypothetical protein
MLIHIWSRAAESKEETNELSFETWAFVVWPAHTNQQVKAYDHW